jgi:hypothetical protein
LGFGESYNIHLQTRLGFRVNASIRMKVVGDGGRLETALLLSWYADSFERGRPEVEVRTAFLPVAHSFASIPLPTDQPGRKMTSRSVPLVLSALVRSTWRWAQRSTSVTKRSPLVRTVLLGPIVPC